MELGLYLKIGTVVLGIIGAIFAYLRHSSTSQSALREQYHFAKEAMADLALDKNMHPFLKEKALQAIAGSRAVSMEEMEYILSLEGSSIRLNEFVKAKQMLLRFDSSSPPSNQAFDFLKKYKAKSFRTFLKFLYISGYCIFAFIAFSPLLFGSLLNIEPVNIGFLFLFTFGAFGFYASLSVNAFVKIQRAESLVSKQKVMIRSVSFLK